MKPHRDLEHGVPVLPSGYCLSCPSWLESVTGLVFSIYLQSLLIVHSLANLVLVGHMLSPNPEVPDKSLLLRLPLASANSRLTPRSDSNHLGKLRKANTRALAPQQHRTTRGIKACVVQEELKDCVFVGLTRESGPTASSLTSLTTGVLHLPTVQRGAVGRHTSDQCVPSFSSSLSPFHYPPPSLGKDALYHSFFYTLLLSRTRLWGHGMEEYFFCDGILWVQYLIC